MSAATPMDNIRMMTTTAVEAEARVYRPGFKYSKIEVLEWKLRTQEIEPEFSSTRRY